MTRPAGRYRGGYLTALARAAGWAGSDPGLPARPRPRSRFEPEPDDDGPSWLLGGADVDDEVPSAVPDDVAPPVTDTGGGDGSGPDPLPAPPAPPAVTVAAPAVARPPAVLPARVAAPAADRPPAADPAPPGRPADAADAAAVPSPDTELPPPAPDVNDQRSARPSPTAPARPVPTLDVAEHDDHQPEESGDHRRPEPDPPDGPGDEPPPRPRATARPAPSVVVDDSLVRPAEAAQSATPPMIIEIGRIEVRIVADGPSSRSAPTPSRTALPAPGPTLADFLDGLAGAAGRSGTVRP